MSVISFYLHYKSTPIYIRHSFTVGCISALCSETPAYDVCRIMVDIQKSHHRLWKVDDGVNNPTRSQALLLEKCGDCVPYASLVQHWIFSQWLTTHYRFL